MALKHQVGAQFSLAEKLIGKYTFDERLRTLDASRMAVKPAAPSTTPLPRPNKVQEPLRSAPSLLLSGQAGRGMPSLLRYNPIEWMSMMN
jgi:hypothetical protein